MAEAIIGTGSGKEFNAELRLVGKSTLAIPEAPSEYRHLTSDGYTAWNPSTWSEQRQCVITGSSSLHAAKSFKAGETLSEFGPLSTLSEPNYLTVQVGEGQHIMLSPSWLQYINHGCDPNVFFNTTTFKLEALKDIGPGDELCFFYPSTEWAMSTPFECRCGSAICCGTITGASRMDRQLVARRRLTDFIRAKLDSAGANAGN